ncbi:MAG: ABC-type branched-chain amino acid transport system, ATPase component [Acidimicrobiales bacterium]|jgi:ABC-type branched-subunit amino acid transport system ATPase component|nr:ABC-type branched-chain amino acid transport system, ATPase component [Acidimicrobiales bacterium]
MSDQGAGDFLVVEDVEGGYGDLQVLFGASLRVGRGEPVAMLGTNGAGKSTLLRMICGLMKPTAGRIWFKGEDVTGMRPARLVDMGLIYIAGGRAIFPSLTVRENLKMSAFPARHRRDEVAARMDEAFELFPRLREREGQPAGTLSGGEQQMVAIGRALVSKPELLMIDELSLGLAPIMLDVIQDMIARLVERRITLLIVEQSLNTAATIAQRAYFMEKGAIRFDGRIDELISRGDLARAVFLGADPNGNGSGARHSKAGNPRST